ncbi:MAG: TauD/TfdA family dioxygenase [Magnetococcales bacterium]|nr:TauD/TfdA family dioxygenase [Magnetococcales bacterium]
MSDTHDSLSPFHPDAPEELYASWRTHKMLHHPTSAEEIMVDVADPYHLADDEQRAIKERLGRCNMAIYRTPLGSLDDPQIAAALLTKLTGQLRVDHNPLSNADGVTPITPSDGEKSHFIPYRTDKLSWHTDGYYNRPEKTVRSLILHCVNAAVHGGENALLDHEILYMRLRDEDADHIRALMLPDALTIPAHILDGVEKRPARSGPIFEIEANGTLLTRYTARKRNIQWRNDPASQAALAALRRIISEEQQFLIRATLRPGWGLLCNNVIHDRSQFSPPQTGEAKRLLYRIRCLDRIPVTVPPRQPE